MIISPVPSPCVITQKFGLRPEVYAKFGLKGHNGIDFRGPERGVSVPVYVQYDSEIVEVGDQGNEGYGKFVRVRTAPNRRGIGKELVYAHLSIIEVQKGDMVNLGDPIGMMGNTGFSSGLHLHNGLRRYDANTNTILDYNNGFKGSYDFAPYILFWTKSPKDVIGL